MVIRMIQYDFATALEYVKKENGKYRIYFPQSCVLYLRGKNGPDFLEMELVMPDGQLVNYKVPVIRAERYTSDMIFQKKLLFLLPFYIIRYEKSVKKIEEDDAAFQTLIAEYGEIGKKLEKEFLAEGKEREYLLTYFHCSIMNFIDGHLEDGINYYFFPESNANSLILL